MKTLNPRSNRDVELSQEVNEILNGTDEERYLKLIVRLLAQQDSRLQSIEALQKKSLLHFKNKVFLIDEVAQVLRISTRTVRKLVEEQKLKRFRCFGKLHFTGQSLLDLIENDPKYFGCLENVKAFQ